MSHVSPSPVFIQTLCICVSLPLCFSCWAAEPPKDQVKVYGQHINGQLVYQYHIINNGPRPISAVRIGWNKNDNDPANSGPELTSMPTGWDPELSSASLPPNTFTVPTGWQEEVIGQEETNESAIGFITSDSDNTTYDIPSGTTLTGLSLTLDKADSTYVNSHAVIFYSSSADGILYMTVPIERLDITAPSLSVTASPSRLLATVGTLVTINVSLTVQDDYDAAPEIKLESITANEPLGSGDISGATFGSDDRQFQLRDVKIPKGSSGRIYTITYSATDGTGNKTTASTTVSVN